MIATATDGLCPPKLRSNVLHDALTNSKLRLILFPTEQCNFRCTYCYEDFAKGRMSRDTIDGVKALIEHRAGDLDFLSLSWFGGEPLIAYDIVREISDHALELSKAYGFTLRGAVTTNGYNLTPERAIALSNYGVTRVQVSLDGDASGHDRTRLRIDGVGTHETIWRRLLSFQDAHDQGGIAYKVLLRIHMHPENQESIFRLAQMISRKLKPSAFTVLLRPIGHWGSKNDKAIKIYDRKCSTFDQLRAALESDLADFILREEAETVNVCYAAKANSFTIRSDGTIGKCTVALNDPANNIGNIARNGELAFNAERMTAWLYSISSMELKDMACPVARLPRHGASASPPPATVD